MNKSIAIVLALYISVVLITFYMNARTFHQTPQARIIQAQTISGDSINSYRTSNGLKPIAPDEQLYLSASHRAFNIANGYSTWSHEGYDEIISMYYDAHTITGENLAKHYKNGSEVVEAWTKSSSHSAVLLNEKICKYGFAQFDTVYVLHVAC